MRFTPDVSAVPPERRWRDCSIRYVIRLLLVGRLALGGKVLQPDDGPTCNATGHQLQRLYAGGDVTPTSQLDAEGDGARCREQLQVASRGGGHSTWGVHGQRRHGADPTSATWGHQLTTPPPGGSR